MQEERDTNEGWIQTLNLSAKCACSLCANHNQIVDTFLSCKVNAEA